MTDAFPVHDEYDIVDGRTIYKSDQWWKAVVLYEGHRGPEIGVYLWKQAEDRWKRKQKYVIRSEEDWDKDREAIDAFLGELAEA